MNTIHEYIKALEDCVRSLGGDVDLLEEYKIHLHSEFKEYRNVKPDLTKTDNKAEKIFVKNLEQPRVIAYSLTGKEESFVNNILLYRNIGKKWYWYKQNILPRTLGFSFTLMLTWTCILIMVILFCIFIVIFFRSLFGIYYFSPLILALEVNDVINLPFTSDVYHINWMRPIILHLVFIIMVVYVSIKYAAKEAISTYIFNVWSYSTIILILQPSYITGVSIRRIGSNTFEETIFSIPLLYFIIILELLIIGTLVYISVFLYQKVTLHKSN
jgi:hypothetical protein